jgi:hypothetical protein
MSVVLTIKRIEPPLLSQGEMHCAMDGDPDFARVGSATWRWMVAPHDEELFINRDENELWTDGSRRWRSDDALQKLRTIAERLEARVFSEEAGEITLCEEEPGSPSSSPLMVALGLCMSAVLLPLLLILALLRLPWILWQITRNK